MRRALNSGGPPIVHWLATLDRSAIDVRPYWSAFAFVTFSESLSSAAAGSRISSDDGSFAVNAASVSSFDVSVLLESR